MLGTFFGVVEYDIEINYLKVNNSNSLANYKFIDLLKLFIVENNKQGLCFNNSSFF